MMAFLKKAIIFYTFNYGETVKGEFLLFYVIYFPVDFITYGLCNLFPAYFST